MLRRSPVSAAYCLAILTLVACNPQTTAPPAKLQAVSPLKFTTPETTLNAWWSFFGDNVLDNLITSALNLNTDFKTSSSYGDPKLELVHKIANEYLEYRYIQNQEALLKRYRQDIEYIIEKADGDWSRKSEKQDFTSLEQERTILETTLRDYEKKQVTIRSNLTKYSSLLPEYVDQILKVKKPMPTADITPLLAADAQNILFAPEVKQAQAEFHRKTAGTASLQKTNAIFPDMSINEFFGIGDSAFTNSQSLWNVNTSSASRNLKTNGLKAEYANMLAFEEFEKTVKSQLAKTEKELIAFNHLQGQKAVLQNAANEAHQVYKNNLNANNIRDIYKTKTAALRAEYEVGKSLLKIYRNVGVY